MEIKITKKQEKPLLYREECTAEISNATTPSYAELKKAIAEKIKKEEEMISIKRIDQKFGRQTMEASFYVYSDKEAFKKFETKKEKKAKVEEKKETK